MLRRQREFRVAADVVAKAWVTFRRFGDRRDRLVAKPLWKEIPRFREFRQQRIEVWHECGDLDLALWIDSQHRLVSCDGARSRSA